MGEMGEKKIVEEWFLVSSLDGGYNRFPFRSLLGLSEYIKKEKEENPGIKTRVIIAGGVLGFLPPYVTKGYLNDVKALREEKKIKVNINALNDMVVATKPHLMRIVENVDEVYYIAGVEDNKNINDIYEVLYNSFRYRTNVQNLWGELGRFFDHEEKLKEIIEQTKFSEEINKKRLEELKEEEKNEGKLNLDEINELINLLEKEPPEDKEFGKKWKEELEKEKERIEEKENYEKELLNIRKKIKLNESELEDCRNIQKLLKEVLLKRYVEYIKPFGLKDISKAVQAVQKELNDILEKYEEEVPPEVFEKLKDEKEEILKKIEEIKNERIRNHEEEINLEKQYEQISKERQQVEEEINKISKERQQVEEEINKLKEQKGYLEKNKEKLVKKEKLDEIEKLIEELKEKSNSLEKPIKELKKKSNSLEKELKSLAKERKKFSYSQKMEEKKSGIAEAAGLARGRSDDAKLILKLALAEYLFYLRNVLGRRENVKIILNGKENDDKFNLLFQNNMTIGEKEIKVATNLNMYGRYIQNSMRIAAINTNNEDFVFFLNSAPCYELVPSDNKKGYSFVIGVPPLVDSEKLKEELSLNIRSKYSQLLLKGLLLPSVVALRFYENGRVGLAILKEPFLYKFSNDRIKKERESLRRRKIDTKKWDTIEDDSKDDIALLNISNKLPTELSNKELSLLPNPEEILLQKYYTPKIEGKLVEVRYYIIGDTHVGAAPPIDITKPSSEELLEGVKKIILQDIQNYKVPAYANVYLALGDIIEAKDFGLVESQIPELPKEFKTWISNKNDIPEEIKVKAKYVFSTLALKRMEKVKYELGEVNKTLFFELPSKMDATVIISGNHYPSSSSPKDKKQSEADPIYEYILNNVKVDVAEIKKGTGEEGYGGIKLQIAYKDQVIGNISIVHKFDISHFTTYPSINVISGHYHKYKGYFTPKGEIIQNGSLAPETAYTQQLAIPTSNELRGFSELNVTYIGKNEAKVEFQPVLYQEIINATENKELTELRKEVGEKYFEEAMQVIQRFIREKTSIIIKDRKPNEFKELLRKEGDKKPNNLKITE